MPQQSVICLRAVSQSCCPADRGTGSKSILWVTSFLMLPYSRCFLPKCKSEASQGDNKCKTHIIEEKNEFPSAVMKGCLIMRYCGCEGDGVMTACQPVRTLWPRLQLQLRAHCRGINSSCKSGSQGDLCRIVSRGIIKNHPPEVALTFTDIWTKWLQLRSVSHVFSHRRCLHALFCSRGCWISSDSQCNR